MGTEFIFALLVLAVIIALGSIKIVRQSQKGIIERLGTFSRVAEPGINFVFPFIEREAAKIDMREHVKDFPPQPVITKDNVAMQIDTVIYYRITDPIKFMYEISNPLAAIENLAATTLRNIIGELDLDETLTSRDTINNKLNITLDEATDPWGIKITRVELKNIIPPRDIQDAMERQMRAERQKRESILIAEGEKQSKILQAEGERQSKILQAQAEKESQILRAEGEAEAIISVQKATAEGTKMVIQAIKEANPTNEVISLKSIEALSNIAGSPSTKLVIPSESVSLLGSVKTIKDIWN